MLYDVTLGGALKPYGIASYFGVLRKRLASDVVALPLPGSKQPMVVLTDPEDFMTVVRSEWSLPSGAATVAWPFKEFFKAKGLREDNAEGDDKLMPFQFMAGNEHWRKGRHMLQPELFRQDTIDGYVPSLAAISTDGVAYIKAKDGKPSLREWSNRLVFEMVTSVLLGERLGLVTKTQSKTVDEFMSSAIIMFEHVGELVFVPPEMGKRTKKWKQFNAGMDRVHVLGRKLLEQSLARNTDSVFRGCARRASSTWSASRRTF